MSQRATMDGVKLKFNPEKTEFIITGDRHARESLIQKFPTQLLGNSISPTEEVKNLRVTFDSGNTFASHITKVCRCLLLSPQGSKTHPEIPQCGDCSPAGKLHN